MGILVKLKKPKLFALGVLTALAGAELILVNTILLLGNAVWYATNIERFIEGALFYIAGFVALGVGYALVEESNN